MTANYRSVFTRAVWVAALGYLVDLYDLVLFGIVRVPSLKALGVPEQQLLETGALLLNLQMAGMLVGGFAWGVLADRKGRMKALYGSILLYSVANLLNAFVTNIPTYGALRFIAGFGLAGELGAAVTLVSEILPQKVRGLGSTIIGLAGFTGAILAAFLGSLVSWQTSYVIGGALGLVLLFARIRAQESRLFEKSRRPDNERSTWGATLKLLLRPDLARRYLLCLLTGMNIWFIAGILIYFSPELAKELGISGPVLAGQAILWSYMGSVAGDVISGLLSQKLRSRKRAIFGFLLITLVLIVAYERLLHGRTPEAMYLFCVFMGLANGYWTLYVAMTSELFGTDVRATVATSIPNLVRGGVIPMTIALTALKPALGTLHAAQAIGLVTTALALLALWRLPETFHRELDYSEAEAADFKAGLQSP